MNCKNCNEALEDGAKFCDNCGAKVVNNRITLRFLLGELFAAMGFESLYFITLKKMLVAPQEVISEYLGGVRKRYVNPFAYIAVGAALSLIVFNYFSEDYKKIQYVANQGQIAELKKTVEKDLSTVKNISKEELKKLRGKQYTAKMQLKFMDTWSEYALKYFNILTFLLLPLYSLMSKLTYRKPNNYGEHLVINAYIQGTTMYVSIITFLLAMLINPNLFMVSMLLVIVYYLYVFGKLYKLSFGKSIVKLMKFIMVFLLIFIPLMVVVGIVGGIIMVMSNPELFKPS